TRLLRRGGELLQGYWLPISLTGIVMLALGYRTYCTVAGRRRFERWLLRLPLVGVMRQRQELSRAASVLATLLESGIVLEQALELVERTSRNPLLTDALAAVRRRITEGSDLGRAVGAERYFPAVFAHVFSIGQESGQLETLLRRIAEDYDRQVDTLATRLSAVLEPTMILILTVVVGFIMFATLLPILESGNVL
ncbi:MAG TPA: type II secretion system F family protein, partial [Pirellulaceae bacterium]|nr:type II secretion system F family protein [Pirellulaceae bacterium]